jgi:Dna[CI] antecedent, DciA
MPKNPPTHKQVFRNSGPPRSAADLLAHITRPGKAAEADPAARIRDLLPAELAPHLREVRVRDGMLIVYAESAAWGARLRLWLMEHIEATAAPLLPELGPGARVLARVMPTGGYRR